MLDRLRHLRPLPALAFLQACAAAFALPRDAVTGTVFVLAGVTLLLIDDLNRLRHRVRALERDVAELTDLPTEETAK